MQVAPYGGQILNFLLMQVAPSVDKFFRYTDTHTHTQNVSQSFDFVAQALNAEFDKVPYLMGILVGIIK